ncbi:MAG: hypothetical protein M1826_006871 [Phylliscum demangeonii]|nr:MAG: hypothetical protein M1826_006871 [Phylliscum demangeonii]
MLDERAFAIRPLVPSAIQHNTKVLSQLRNLTSSLFGIAAGILGLEAYAGFGFYLLGTVLVSALVWALLADGTPGRYFGTPASMSRRTTTASADDANADADVGAGWQLWTEEVVGGLSSFVLTWTLFYGLVRA